MTFRKLPDTWIQVKVIQDDVRNVYTPEHLVREKQALRIPSKITMNLCQHYSRFYTHIKKVKGHVVVQLVELPRYKLECPAFG
jgi:hypothetical protein